METPAGWEALQVRSPDVRPPPTADVLRDGRLRRNAVARKEPITIQCAEELYMGTRVCPKDWRFDEVTDDLLVRAQICTGAVVEVSIPRGYRWDGASIPRFCWWIIGRPKDPRFALASLVHDWICEEAETRPQRVFGDACFLWLLRDAGVAPWRHYAMFLAVTAYRRLVWRAVK